MSIKVEVPALFTVCGKFVKGEYPNHFYYFEPNKESLVFTEKIFLSHLGDHPSPIVDTLCGLGYYKTHDAVYYISMVKYPIADKVSEYRLGEIEKAFLDEAYDRISGLGKGLTDVKRNDDTVSFKFAPESFDDERSAKQFLKELALVIHELCYEEKNDKYAVVESHRRLKIRVHPR